jgi:hypothetical protein
MRFAGDFFPKRSHGEPKSYANARWPVSNPGTHGFDEWVSTEASGPSSTPNCGCNPDWKAAGQGCISGGGVWRTNRSWVCKFTGNLSFLRLLTYRYELLTGMNYWQPANGSGSSECRSAEAATRSCVTNSTVKITGDDAEHIIDSFDAFLNRSVVTKSQPPPFLAVLWLHTIHMPRGAMPQFFHAYKDAFGDPAGDYLGSITQMDVQVGRLRNLLQERGLAQDTMLWCLLAPAPPSLPQPPFSHSIQGNLECPSMTAKWTFYCSVYDTFTSTGIQVTMARMRGCNAHQGKEHVAGASWYPLRAINQPSHSTLRLLVFDSAKLRCLKEVSGYLAFWSGQLSSDEMQRRTIHLIMPITYQRFWTSPAPSTRNPTGQQTACLCCH